MCASLEMADHQFLLLTFFAGNMYSSPDHDKFRARGDYYYFA